MWKFTSVALLATNAWLLAGKPMPQHLNIMTDAQVEEVGNVAARQTLEALADLYAARHEIDPPLLRAVITQESNWDTQAVSSAGALGLMQLMPDTARGECGLAGEQVFEPAQNLNCGAGYLAKQLRRFGNIELALAAYNSGPSRVARLGRVPRLRETQDYVRRISTHYYILKAGG
jgi:soluble lytic murein transglycosylase-like protein